MTARSRTAALLIAAGIVGLLVPIARGESPPRDVRKAEAFFRGALADDNRRPIVLAGLRSTEDADLLPLFAALSRSGEKDTRLLATAMVGKVGGKEASDILLERLRHDPFMVIRSEALVQLALLENITDEQLTEAANMPDEHLQSIACRALARRGQANSVLGVLQKLADSSDADTRLFARLSLLGLGDHRQISPLRKEALDPQTPTRRLTNILDQIRMEKIRAALPLVELLTGQDQGRSVRVRAFMALGELSPKASEQILRAIYASESPMFQINLLRILAERIDAEGNLRDLAGSGLREVAVLATFELARRSPGDDASRHVRNALALEHPIVIEYVLNRFAEDVKDHKKDRAEMYVDPVLEYLDTLELPRGQMTLSHDRAALAVELLAELGTPRAMEGLKMLLAGKTLTPIRQLTAGALYRSNNPEVCAISRGLLASPFSELKTYAALLLARHGHLDALPSLRDIQQQEATQRTETLTLVNWYILKLSNQSRQTVESLAESVG